MNRSKPGSAQSDSIQSNLTQSNSAKIGRVKTNRIKNALCAAGVGLVLSGCAGGSANLSEIGSAAQAALDGSSRSGALTNADIVSGLKEALATGSRQVTSQLGQANGFSADPVIRIPLPESLQKAREVASKVGLEGSFDDLEDKLNEAAEQATPKAQTLFIDAISEMSVEDATGILRGPDDAATDYFRGRTGDKLNAEMRPIVDSALANVGAVSSFNQLLVRYNNIPFAPAVNADLSSYVVEKASDGIFYYLAEEEKAIRENPLKRTTELLQRVFASQ